METSSRSIGDSDIRVTNLFYEITMINIYIKEDGKKDKSMEKFFRELYSVKKKKETWTI